MADFPIVNTIKSIFSHAICLPGNAVYNDWITKAKILAFVACFIGFWYQTISCLHIYFSYATTVNMYVSYPSVITPPAITVCNRNRIRRSVACLHDYCIYYPKDVFCNSYPNYCPDIGIPFTGMPSFASVFLGQIDWNETETMAHTERMIEKCEKVIGEKHIPCRIPYRKVPVVSNEGDLNFCYTIDSEWEEPEADSESYPYTLKYHIDLITEPDEYLISTTPVAVMVAIHDRKKLVNPYIEGQVLKAGDILNAHVSEMENFRLPAPYASKCVDYLKSWKENGGTGPLNARMCIEKCKLDTLKSQGSCIDGSVFYPHREEVCEKHKVVTTQTITEMCRMRCGDACYDREYEVRYEVSNTFEEKCFTSYCRLSRIRLNLNFQQFKLTRLSQQPSLSGDEAFSHIGGYFSMWFGLFPILLFCLIEAIFCLTNFVLDKYGFINKTSTASSDITGSFQHSVFHNDKPVS